MYRPVSSRPDFPAMELDVLKLWRETKAFDKLVARNRGHQPWSFIDGPITANNPMGVHHAWGRTYKDLYQRYHAMQGFDERYQNGFDCQGLWVEVEVEKELGLNSKRDIEGYGLANFSRKCRERVLKYSGVQTEQSIRLGQWMDWDHSYYTMTDQNIESIWQFLKRCQEKGWLYRGARSMPWCTRCGTSLSQHELIDSYRDMTHTSVYVRLPVVGREREYLLVWTTTPWTLAANVAAAVHPDLDYAVVRQRGDTYYLSQGALRAIRGEHEIVGTLKGRELVGWQYVGPFDYLPAVSALTPPAAPLSHSAGEGPGVRADVPGPRHRVVPWSEVSEEEGTGIVHIAPGCGAEDYELSKVEGLPVIAPIDENGNYYDGSGWLSGRNALEVAQPIVTDLEKRGLLYAVEDYSHRYPVCWRCATELVFRLVDEWFISAQGIRQPMIDAARTVEWVPEYAGKRMEDWLNNMGDWCISRKRFWGLPLPFYICPKCDELTVVSSKRELESLAVSGLEQLTELHRPWIDAVKIRCPKCGEVVSRITEVGDCWLDAGIVPYSTLDYFGDRAYWAKWFPAELVIEMREQIRLWFYSMLFMSVTLTNQAPYKRVFVYEKLMDEYGRPMHKSAGNAIWFDEAVEKMGADVMRWIYCGQSPTTNLNFGYGLADETRRKLLTLWNVYSFWVTYAEIDRFDPTKHSIPVAERSHLDRWIISKLNVLVGRVRESLDALDAAAAIRAAEAFFEDLSNWYVRRSRRRFWKSGEDADKVAAYLTLYEVLVTTAKLLAPVIPFMTEEMYQNLVRSVDASAPESVHHAEYPVASPALIDEALLADVDLVQKVVNLGRSARMKANLKVRQPLGELVVKLARPEERPALERLAPQVLDELNVKSLSFAGGLAELVTYTVRPRTPILGPKYGRELPKIVAALKSADQAAVARKVEAGEPVELDGFTLLPEELEVLVTDRPGYSVATEAGYAVGVSTTLTPELVEEGLARELVHRIQTMRKAADFRIEEQIVTYYQGDPELARVLNRFAPYIKQETLSRELRPGTTASGYAETIKVDGRTITLAVSRS